MQHSPSPEGERLSGDRDAHRAERSRRVKWSIVSALMTKPLAVVMPIVTVPLFLHYLGRERYGLYESVGALTIWLGLSNAGLTLGLVNNLTACHVAEDRELARRHVSSLFFILLCTTTLMSLAVMVAVPLISWQGVFPADSALARSETPWAVWTAALITLWGLLLGIPQAIYTGYQENHLNNVWDGLAKLLTLLACVLVMYTRWGLVGTIVASAGTAILVRTANVIVLFGWAKPWLRPSLRYFDRKLLLGTVRQGIGLFVISSSAVAIFQAGKLIIGHFIGPDAVAVYSVTGRPFLVVFGFYTLLMAPLWPAHGEALRRGDVEWAKRALQLSVSLGCGAVVACGAVMYLFGDTILRVWTRGAFVQVSGPLVFAMTALFVVWVWMSSQSILLNSAGVLRAQMWLIGLHAVLSVIVAVVVARPFGVIGVAWSVSITGLFTSVWGYPWLLRRHIFCRVREAKDPS
jgi:O-antigen/teichoic acid export membrane protein